MRWEDNYQDVPGEPKVEDHNAEVAKQGGGNLQLWKFECDWSTEDASNYKYHAQDMHGIIMTKMEDTEKNYVTEIKIARGGYDI